MWRQIEEGAWITWSCRPQIKYKKYGNNNKRGKTWLGLFLFSPPLLWSLLSRLSPVRVPLWFFVWVHAFCSSILSHWALPLPAAFSFSILASTSMTFSPKTHFRYSRTWIMHACWFFIGLFSLKNQYTLAQHKKMKTSYLLKGFKEFSWMNDYWGCPLWSRFFYLDKLYIWFLSFTLVCNLIHDFSIVSIWFFNLLMLY